MLPLFNPSQRHHLSVWSPTSLAVDGMGYLFIASGEGIAYLRGSELETLQPLQNEGIEIAIYDKYLFVLNPLTEKIDVYSIVYTAPGANAQ